MSPNSLGSRNSRKKLVIRSRSIHHSFAATYVRLSPEILLFPGFQAFFISIFSHILLDIYGCICYNSHSGGAYYAFKENKNQYRTYLSCDC